MLLHDTDAALRTSLRLGYMCRGMVADTAPHHPRAALSILVGVVFARTCVNRASSAFEP